MGSTWRLTEGAEIAPDLYAWNMLGQGRRFETWLAWSASRWSPVCVKLPRADEICERTLAALAREHDAVSAMAHPSVQRLFEAHLDADPPYLVYEYAEGINLSHGLGSEGPMTPDNVVWLGLELAAALHYIHGRGFVHLDLKPSNIVVRDGRAIVMDFDIALPVGGQRSRTKPRGTHSYMAPEQIRCEPAAVSMDLFALGLTLYRVATGTHPFDVSSVSGDTAAARLRPFRQLDEEVTPLMGLVPQMSQILSDVVERLMKRDPLLRPQSALEVVRSLEAAIPAAEPGLGPRWTRNLPQALTPVAPY